MAERATGVIHDIGYQRYTGPRLGRGYAVRSLYVHALRTSFGLGRTAKAKIFPWFVIGVLMVIALIMVAVRAETGKAPVSYVDYDTFTSTLALLFLAVVAPELVSRDLRTKVLPLYFSRPMSRTDYALAKLGALMSSLWLIFAVPLLVMFLGAVFSLHDAASVGNELIDFLQGLVATGIMAIVFATFALLIASLMSRRMVAAAAIVGAFLITLTVGGVISVIISGAGGNGDRVSNLLSPQLLVQGLNRWLFSGDPDHTHSFGYVFLAEAVLLAGGCVLLLIARYRKVQA